MNSAGAWMRARRTRPVTEARLAPAAALDRMLGQCRDRDLAAKLAPIRGTVGAAVDDLGERCEMVKRTPSDLAYFRRCPWDKLYGAGFKRASRRYNRK